MTKFLIMDGTNIACRTLMAGENELTNSEGLPTGYIYRFFNCFFKIMKIVNPTHIVICWDISRKTWRKEIYSEYKSNRGPKEENPNISFKNIKDILSVTGILNYEFDGYEGDDLVGSFANISLAEKNYIVSGDRDIFQLINNNTVVLFPSKKEWIEVDKNYIKENYGIDVNQYIDMKALMGDAGDNIPGIEGMGEKTASKLLNQYNNIENIVNADVQELFKNQKKQENFLKWKENYSLYKKLVTIDKFVPLEIDFDDCINKVDWNNAISYFEKFEFKSFLNKIEQLPKGESI